MQQVACDDVSEWIMPLRRLSENAGRSFRSHHAPLDPYSPDRRDLYEEILAAMGGIFAHGTSVTTLRHRIRSLARQLEVRLLVIDEIHSLLAGTYREHG